MFKLKVSQKELFNEKTNEFLYSPEVTISLEHSLVSISKWESKWKKPFLTTEVKPKAEMIDYIRCMNITQNINDDVFQNLSASEIKMVEEYIDDSMTATWFSDDKSNKKVATKDGKVKFQKGKIITSEVIYSWMVSLQIPMECQKWHLNRLMTLIRVCNESNKPKKKMSKKDILANNDILNKQRREMLHSKG